MAGYEPADPGSNPGENKRHLCGAGNCSLFRAERQSLLWQGEAIYRCGSRTGAAEECSVSHLEGKTPLRKQKTAGERPAPCLFLIL